MGRISSATAYAKTSAAFMMWKIRRALDVQVSPGSFTRLMFTNNVRFRWGV